MRAIQASAPPPSATIPTRPPLGLEGDHGGIAHRFTSSPREAAPEGRDHRVDFGPWVAWAGFARREVMESGTDSPNPPRSQGDAPWSQAQPRRSIRSQMP